eukprot:TRINITY_DN81023_c0_g1_i1.p1 TRINITY_DN81023_c0_g1~~TRINITY_DN81023_c0_g1_i1.p1  ORF type:complete len:229 (+),score=42.09 TRINITY_DN81023_c0_g1_i1:94-780(+)
MAADSESYRRAQPMHPPREEHMRSSVLGRQGGRDDAEDADAAHRQATQDRSQAGAADDVEWGRLLPGRDPPAAEPDWRQPAGRLRCVLFDMLLGNVRGVLRCIRFSDSSRQWLEDQDDIYAKRMDHESQMVCVAKAVVGDYVTEYEIVSALTGYKQDDEVPNYTKPCIRALFHFAEADREKALQFVEFLDQNNKFDAVSEEISPDALAEAFIDWRQQMLQDAAVQARM